MRRVLLAVLVLGGCRTVHDRAAVRSSSSPPAAHDAGVVAPTVELAPVPPPAEAPLAWGTRPPKEGPLFPVVDGLCQRPNVWPLGTATFYTAETFDGAWTKGGAATFGHFTDDGIAYDAKDTLAAATKDTSRLDVARPVFVAGSWPGPAVMWSYDRNSGRMREYDSLWAHGEGGWKLLGTHEEKDQPTFTRPALYRGHVVTTRAEYSDTFVAQPQRIQVWKATADAAAIPGIASLARPGLKIDRILGSEGAIYAFGTDASGSVIRWVADGKAGELAFPRTVDPVGTTKDALYVQTDTAVERIEGGKRTTLGPKLPAGVGLKDAQLAPDGSVWMLTTKNVVAIVRGDTVSETTLPAPKAPKTPIKLDWHPITGGLLAGVDVDDPWALGEGGTVYHYASGAWHEVALPPPPFATAGRYQAQSLTVRAKGDAYVNASYLEKGIGWPGARRYDAILRSKRPTEVLRCNERLTYNGLGASGFMSFPPIATAACTTPFVILLRTAYHMTTGHPDYVFDRKSDFPSVRAALKGMTALGETIDLVEIASGEQRYLGAKVPSLAAGTELALAVTKKVETTVVQTPEVVCGTPKEERVIRVDVATGKVVN